MENNPYRALRLDDLLALWGAKGVKFTQDPEGLSSEETKDVILLIDALGEAFIAAAKEVKKEMEEAGEW